MSRIVFSMIALLLLMPLLYVIFFTQFIPFLLRKLNIGRSTGEVKNLVNDAEQATENRVRDREASKQAMDDGEPETIIPDEVISPPKTKNITPTNTPTE